MLTTVNFVLVWTVIVSCQSAIIQSPHLPPHSPQDKKGNLSLENNETMTQIVGNLSQWNDTIQWEDGNETERENQTSVLSDIWVGEGGQIFNQSSFIIEIKPMRQSARIAQLPEIGLNQNVTNSSAQTLPVSMANLAKLLQNLNLLQVGTRVSQNSSANSTNVTKPNLTQNMANLINLLDLVKTQNQTKTAQPNSISSTVNTTIANQTASQPTKNNNNTVIAKNTTKENSTLIIPTPAKPILTSPIINPVSPANGPGRGNNTNTSTVIANLSAYLNGTANKLPNTTINATSNTSKGNTTVNTTNITINKTNTTTNGTNTGKTNSTRNSSSIVSLTTIPFASNPKPSKTVVNREFAGVGLYHNIPLTFVKNQVFKFGGVVENSKLISFTGDIKYNYVNIVFSEWGGSNEFRCIQQITDKSLQFEISCKMEASGRYLLSIFAGRYGQSSFRQRNILTTSIETLLAPFQNILSPANKTKSLTLGVFDNNLVIFWDSKEAITNITIYQNKTNLVLKQQYILSNFHQKFRVPYIDFKQFQETETYVTVSHARSSDGTLSKLSSKFNSEPTTLKFKAVRHDFSSNANNLFKIEPSIPWKMNVGQKFKFSGVFNEDVRNQVYLVSPNQQINKVYFVQNQNKSKIPVKSIKAGTPVFLQISFATPGSHILQINAVSGMAIVNRPVYVGEGYPLIPDYQDLQNYEFSRGGEDDQYLLQEYVQKTTTKFKVTEPARDATLTQKRQYMLSLLNSLRKKYKEQPIVIDEMLNNIAQKHSDDMHNRNYFSHTNPDGLGPGERARKMNFTSSIGQNIAQSNSLTQAHLGLERSASHLENSVSPLWSRVGIGITPTRNDQYIVAFQFSTRDLKKNPLSKDELKKYQEDLLKVIKQKNPNIVKQNPQLSDGITKWMESNRDTQMFQYLFNQGKYRGPMISSSFTVSFQEDWVDELKNTDMLNGFSKFSQVGVGLGVEKNSSGKLESYIVFA